MKTLPLFKVTLYPVVYRETMRAHLRVAPTAEGEALLARHRLVWKPLPDGGVVLSPVDGAGKPRFPLAPAATLTFDLQALSERLFLDLDLKSLLAMRAPRFEATCVPGVRRTKLKLVDAAAGGGGRGARPGRGVLAGIAVANAAALTPSEEPEAYFVVIMPRRQRWVYYVVSDARPTTSDPFSILDTGPVRTQLSWPASGTRDLGRQPDASDPVAVALAERYPTLSKVRLVSAAFAPTDAIRRNIELHIDGRRVLEALPNPRSPGGLPPVRPGLPQEEMLYCVVEHLTQGLP